MLRVDIGGPATTGRRTVRRPWTTGPGRLPAIPIQRSVCEVAVWHAPAAAFFPRPADAKLGTPDHFAGRLLV